MFIEKVIAEGFKSYAERTEISGFHPHFNAITGLNGSGKSNILDSICFVLGISNLSQVRVNNLQDLIYKQGQSSITKASVTISFNNFDKLRSPVGYESHDKIQVTRIIDLNKEGKYLINGKIAKKHSVLQLFHSVQLNVNNPHFLIMQGRITKVLNMKPIEILSMIEEAAGTRMYENNKIEALKQIEKKEAKLVEIDNILINEICPSLEKLRLERSSYIEYKKIERQRDILKRFSIAKRYYTKENFLVSSFEKIKEIQENYECLVNSKLELENSHEDVRKKLDQCQLLEKESNNNYIKEVEKTSNALATHLVKEKTILENISSTLLSEVTKQNHLVETNLLMANTMKDKKENLISLELNYRKQLIIVDELTEKVQKLENKFESLRTGVIIGEGNLSLREQLEEYKKQLQNVNTQKQQATIKLNNVQRSYDEKKESAKNAELKLSEIQKDIKNKENEIIKLKNLLTNLGHQEDFEKEITSLETCSEDLKKNISRKKESFNELNCKLTNLDFQYSLSSTSLKPNSIKGMIVKLIKVLHLRYCTALEVSAGGKLFNIVVDNQKNAVELITNGKLRNRVTVIPTENIIPRVLPNSIIEKAQNIAGGKEHVVSALSLLQYKEDVKKAIDYVFGNIVVCSSAEVAKIVTFDKTLKLKSVTLDGDLYEPSGTITGGSKNFMKPIIQPLHELNELETFINKSEKELESIEKRLSNLYNNREKYREKLQFLNLKEHDLKLVQETLHTSPVYQQVLELKQIEKQIESVLVEIQTLEQQEKTYSLNCSEIESEMKSFHNSRDSHLFKLETQINMEKNQLAKEKTASREMQNYIEEIKFELEQIEIEMIENKKQYEELSKNIETLTFEEQEHQKQLETTLNNYTSAKENLTKCQQELNFSNEQKQVLLEELGQIENSITDNKVELKTTINSKNRLESQINDAREEIKRIENEYSWIIEERNQFGVPKSSYDFNNKTFENCSKQLDQCEKQMNSLKHQINFQAVSRYEEVEAENNSLLKRKETVLKDKETIYRSIQELDEKKNLTLEKTFMEVNNHFSSIFSTLLPGTRAKLLAVNENNLLEGVEVKIAFGNEWKTSLTELSGGQKSLVALSLILALLRYKPAPMYILDEVDSALDLSHTQNIGKMLKSHFSESQFIIVSLKEGMYDNANVLFKTLFVNGISTVTRIAKDVALNSNTVELDTKKKNTKRSVLKEKTINY